MKFILIATLLSLAVANTFFLRAPATAADDNAVSCGHGFFTGFFKHFGLEEPTQLLNCFDKKSNDLFFKKLEAVSDLVQDAEGRRTVKVHIDLVKLLALHKALEPVHSCIAQTQDLQDLMKALGGSYASDEAVALAKYIYYQANFGKLASSVPQVVAAVHNNDYAGAGDLAADIVNSTVNEIRTQGLALLAVDGLQNGIHITLGLPDAQSVFSCWNNDTANTRLEFLYGLSVAVTNGDKEDAAANTEAFYEHAGKDLINKIPAETWKCWGESDDVKLENDKLMIDITGDGFHQRVAKFVSDHQCAYWHIQKTIRSSLEQHNFHHAGTAYAHLMQAAAGTH